MTKQAAQHYTLTQWFIDWLPALPLLVLAYGLVVAPIAMLLMQSFLTDDGSFTLTYWVDTLASRNNQRAIFTSINLGVVSATLALLIGSPIAWLISRMTLIQRSVWLATLNIATNFGGIGLAFGFVAILGTYGMLTLSLQQLAIPFVPPAPGSFGGLVIAYAYTNIPLFILLTLPGMGILRQEWWEAAQTSGATQWQFWRSIGLPILAPFLTAGWVLVFTWAIGLYGLPLALGVGSTQDISLITVQMGETLESDFFGRQQAAVLSMLLLLLAGISLSAYRFILRRATRWF
jgi:putative spermidine/putrescine transport system permease protein